MADHPLKQYRDKANLTQEQLAEKLGVSRQMIGLIETGERSITPNNALEWEKLIPVTKEALCPEIFNPPVKPARKVAAA